jgi:type II secretory pathway pseudopilin PulG
MKTEAKQSISYKSFILAASLLGLLGFMAIPSWTRQLDEERIVGARRHAEVLGYQVFEIYNESGRSSAASEVLNSRSPASMRTTGGDSMNFREAGSIGIDPWGQPYRYKILSAAKDQLKVQIWSAGPNKAFETEDESGVGADSYTGDDVGVILSLNKRPAE